MKVLVTGSAGFIGTALRARLINHGHEVVDVNRSTHGDIQNISNFPRLFYGVDAIFHLASTVNNYTFLQDKTVDVKANILGTIHLLEMYKKHCPGAWFNYVSTFFARGNGGMYGITKGCAAEIVQYYSDVFGLPANVQEINNVFGIGEKTGSQTKCALMRQLRELYDNRPAIKVYREKTYRDYIYIDDVVTNLLRYYDKPMRDMVVIGCGESVLYSDLIQYAIDYAGSSSRIEWVQPTHFHVYSSPLNPAAVVHKMKCEYTVWSGIQKVIDTWRAEDAGR